MNSASENPGSAGSLVRLNKFLRSAGVDSRRHCDELISAGRVTVNGRLIDELGTKVDPSSDVVEVDGNVVTPPSAQVTIMLNKPAGYLTTMSDPAGKPCVAELVPIDEHPALYHIGRLDNDTSGLLVFSTDGSLGHGLLHPSRLVWKTYLARVEGPVLPGQVARLEEGVDLDGRITAPARVELLESSKRSSLLRISIHEGMNRQVRRMCQAVGHPVLELKRIAFANLVLGDLAEGAWRALTTEELEGLRDFAQHVQPMLECS